MSHEALNPRQFFHATDVDLQPGEMLHPPSVTGIASRWSDVPTYRGDRVYMFSHRSSALGHGDQYGKHVYEVAPEGDVERDPEYVKEKRRIRRLPRPERDEANGYNALAAQTRIAKSARIIGKIER